MSREIGLPTQWVLSAVGGGAFRDRGSSAAAAVPRLLGVPEGMTWRKALTIGALMNTQD